ncbi:hypothetical protein PSPO01_16218 [Paraphaeosphaeria sporulosa]
MDDSASISFHLPDEIWLMIVGHIDAPEWKQIRQTCRQLNKLTTPLLFERVYFELCGRGCESLYNISSSTVLSPIVNALVLRRISGYRGFPDSETWAKSTHQPGDPCYELAPPSDASYCDNVQTGDGLLPYTEWIALSKEQKEALYHEYEADRKQAQKELRDITTALRFRIIGAIKAPLIHPHRAFSFTAVADGAVEQFHKALEALPNLKAFYHEPGFLYDDDWACRWRNLYFHHRSLIGHTNYLEDEDAEVLQLSVVLQSLALVRRGDRRLRTLSIYVGGPAFATPERLQHLWAGNGHEVTRLCRGFSRNAAEADREAYSVNSTPEKSKLYHGQLSLMRHAFVALTHLDYVVSDDDELPGSLDIAAKLVFGFLIATKGLEKLRLVFGRLVDGILQPLSRYEERQCAMDSIRLLDGLTRHSSWTRICELELEIATDRNTLVRFLLAHKDTLRSLTLTRISLVRLGDPLNTWELTLTEIAQGLSLNSLTLSNLFDFPQEWARGVQGRMLFDSKAEVGKER